MFKATTICAVRRNGVTAMAGDGQVTMGESVIMKGTAKKVRRIYGGKVVTGFAGSVADAFAPYAVDLSLQNETAANALAETLEGYVLRDKIPALDDGQTDTNGLLRFPASGKSLMPGL